MISDNGSDQIRWDLVPDTFAELFGDLSNARDALAKSKFAKAEKIGMSVLARLVAGQTERESTVPTAALRAPAEAVVGIAAHEQGQSDLAQAHLTAATSFFGELLGAGYALDAASRGEYVRALLLTDRVVSALEFTHAILKSGRELSSPVVLQVTGALRAAGDTEPAIDLLTLAHHRWPDRVDVADALVGALEEDAQRDAAAQVHLELAVLLARQGDYAESEAHFRRSPAGAPATIAGLAQVLLAQGKTEQAVETVGLSVGQGPSHPEIVAVRAEVLAKAGDTTRAIEVARDGLDTFGDYPALVRTYVRLLIDAGKDADAAPLLERALAEDPDDMDLLQAKAEVLLAQGKPADAIAILQPRVEEFPESAGHRVTLVRALITVGDELGAFDVLQAGLSMRPDDASLLSERAAVEESLVRYAQRHFDELTNPSVRTALESALALNNANWLAHAWLGEVLRREGEFPEALAHLDLAVGGMPDSGWVVGTRGQVLYTLGRPEGLDELRRAAELDDSLAWVHAELGDAYRLAHRYREALAELARATELAPDDGWSWALTGATQFLLGDWEKARSSLDEATRLVPHYAWALAVKANLLTSIDELDDALRTISASLDTDPQIGWGWGLKSSLLDLLDGDPAEQEQAARTALQLEPGDIFLLICLGEALLRQRKDDEAESHFRAGVDSGAASSELGVDSLQHLAWCYLRLRQYDQALDCLSAVLAKNFMPSAGYDLGLTLLCAGRYDVALEEYQDVTARTMAEPHVGRRRHLVKVARHDLQGMLDGGQIKPGPEVENVQQVLDQVPVTDSAASA
jgi:tetratricopeptide (TPR) repeat protein